MIETAGAPARLAAGEQAAGATRHLVRPGGRIGYDVSGEGPLVVCVPGMGDLRSVYRSSASDLVVAGYRVATMDLRGHGDSDTTFDAYDDVAAGQDVLALIDVLGGPAVVIGNSMGAGAAAWAAAEDPTAVSGLVLIGPFVRNAQVGRAKEIMFRALLWGPWGRWAWRAWLAQLYPGRRGPAFEAHRAEVMASLSGPGRWRAFQATTRTTHAPVEARMVDVQARTLVVMGDRDPDFVDPQTEAEWIAGRLNGEVLMVPGSGHYPQAEFPEIVGPRLVEFVDRVARRA